MLTHWVSCWLTNDMCVNKMCICPVTSVSIQCGVVGDFLYNGRGTCWTDIETTLFEILQYSNGQDGHVHLHFVTVW